MKTSYTIHVGLSGPGASFVRAEGGSFIATEQTHLTVGEGNRPELVTVIPLVSDIFSNTGKKDQSLGLNLSAEKVNSQSSNVQSNISPIQQQQIVFSAPSTGGSGSSRVVVLNINQPINIDGTQIGRNMVSKTFEDVDNQI